MDIYVYPSISTSSANMNPYIVNLRNSLETHFNVLSKRNKLSLPLSCIFFSQSWKADAYILNWIENAASSRLNFINALMCLLGLYVIKCRNKMIVWMFHNIHPHDGESFWSKRIKYFLFNNSTIIISHSKEGADYAKQYAKCPVYFKNHPVEPIDYGKWEGETPECDFLYWSSVLPYKGLAEFLAHPLCRLSGKKIIAIGKCNDPILSKKIKALTNNNIVYENRTAEFAEIAALCKKAKYVIFPYIGESISSSGVLMDTLLMGGTPVGPDRGAFADLAELGCCITYNNIDDVFKIIR